jgi:hypothetical protein
MKINIELQLYQTLLSPPWANLEDDLSSWLFKFLDRHRKLEHEEKRKRKNDGKRLIYIAFGDH